jgi:PhoH-like ATPase
MESWADGKSGTMFYRVTGPSVLGMLVNQFVYQENPDGSTPFYAQVKEINGKTALFVVGII